MGSLTLSFSCAYACFITHSHTQVLCFVCRFMDHLCETLESHIGESAVEGGYILYDSDYHEGDEGDEGEESDIDFDCQERQSVADSTSVAAPSTVESQSSAEAPPSVYQVTTVAARCPWTTHCDGCDTLHNSTFLKDGEFPLHGCCGGTSSLPAGACKAYPEPHTEDLLRQVIIASTEAEGPTTNSHRRNWAFVEWFRQCRDQSQLPDSSYVVDGKVLYRWSGCVLRKVRQAWPSPEYLGFRGDQ